MLDSLSELIADGLKGILGFFPPSPFAALTEMAAEGQIAEWLGYLNWFVPVGSFVAILELWLTCIAVYYVWQIILRWVKVIE